MVGVQDDYDAQEAAFRRRVFWVVLGVWVVNFAAGLIGPLDYKPDPTVHAIFATIAGSVYVVSNFRRPPGGGV